MIALRQPDKNMNQSISARYRFPPIFSDSTSSPGLPISGFNEFGYLSHRHMRSVISITHQGAPAPFSV